MLLAALGGLDAATWAPKRLASGPKRECTAAVLRLVRPVMSGEVLSMMMMLLCSMDVVVEMK